MKCAYLAVLVCFCAAACVGTYQYREADVRRAQVGPQPDGSILVPTGQVLRPAGLQVLFPGRPVDLALLPGEQILVVKNRKDLVFISVEDRKIVQTLPLPRSGNSFTGLKVGLGGDRIYVTEARSRLLIVSWEGGLARWLTPIELPKSPQARAVAPGGLSLSGDGRTAYVALSGNNSLGIVDLESRTTREIPVGMAPYGVVLVGEDRAYVSNWGGRRPRKGDKTARSAGSDIVVDPETGIASSGTVSVVDLARETVVAEIEVGLHPSGIVANPRGTHVFVANANSDTVSVIDTTTNQVVETISTRPDADLLFGSAPNALEISPDGRTLYVANGGNNAVAIVSLGRRAGVQDADRDESRVRGYLPTGWYPGGLRLSSSGNRLFVANVKGIGSRNQRTSRPGLNSHDHTGSVSIINLPDETDLDRFTKIVLETNRVPRQRRLEHLDPKGRKPVPVPRRVGEPSVFEHVLYIIKENRTYDQVFGDLPQGNGDPRLVHYGREVTPNHHALAEEFTLFDNFYCSGVLSADGHQWTDEAYVTDYIEKFFGDFTRSYPYDGDDPLAYASSGFIWDNVLRHGLTFRNYGEMVQWRIDPPDAGWTQIYRDFVTGTNKVSITVWSEIETLNPYLCPTYIGFTGRVPDIHRAAQFLAELEEFERRGELPNFMIMLLPNDHTVGTRPGFPTPRATVADNDLALGRIVDAVSHSRFWPKTCIFVVEDDPQAGLDHVDSHRTVALVISPYTKRRFVDGTYYDQCGMVRTMELILGLPPMNQMDAAADPMRRCFTDRPDFTPYKCRPNNVPLDEMNPPLESLSGPALYWAQQSIEQPLDELDEADEDVLNRILWHAAKGYEVPYPRDFQQVRAG